MTQENRIDATEPVPGEEQIKKVEADEIDVADLEQISGGVMMLPRD